MKKTKYEVQEHLKPKALARISEAQIEEHWKLYEGYVKNTNEMLDELGEADPGSRAWSELKRRLGFEFDGMVLHEYYFGNLAAGAALSPQSDLAASLAEHWNGLPGWREDFAGTAAMRGIGWVILYHDPAVDRLFNWWVSEHEINHPAGLNPILVLDVFEHAWMVDYGASDKGKYVEAFLDNVAWSLVEHRFKASRTGERPARF
jgi:superoxide dismutase, Fe-Mn family